MTFSRKTWTIFCLVISCSSAMSSVVNKENERTHHKLLLVSFDGFSCGDCFQAIALSKLEVCKTFLSRWDYWQRNPDMEAFNHLRENGVKAKYMKSVFPTQTSPNHFSIATGLYAESHGVVHNCNYNISDGPPISTFYSTLQVNEWWDNGAEPIWITAVNQGLKSGGYLFPGSYANISGVSATKKILETVRTPSEESDWRDRIDETMEWFTMHDLDMVALYFEQPDVDSHEYGPDSDKILDITLPLVNRTMMYLFERVEEYGLTDDLNMIFVSDHGFQTIDTTVKGDEAISIARYVDQDYVDFQFSYGPLGIVEPTAGNASYVAERLREGNPHMDVYLKEDLPESWHYKNSDRVTSIVIVSHPGYAVYPIFPGFHINAGEHGYDNALENMRASYHSIGPSFKKGVEIDGFESVNIYPLMCHLLGLTPAPNNGSLDVLFDTLSGSGNIVGSFTCVLIASIFSCVSLVWT